MTDAGTTMTSEDGGSSFRCRPGGVDHAGATSAESDGAVFRRT